MVAKTISAALDQRQHRRPGRAGGVGDADAAQERRGLDEGLDDAPGHPRQRRSRRCATRTRSSAGLGRHQALDAVDRAQLAELRLQRLPRHVPAALRRHRGEAGDDRRRHDRADDQRQPAEIAGGDRRQLRRHHRAVRDAVDLGQARADPVGERADHVGADPRQRHQRRRQLDDVLHFLAARDLAALRGVAEAFAGGLFGALLGHRRLSGAPPRRARPAGRPAPATCGPRRGRRRGWRRARRDR